MIRDGERMPDWPEGFYWSDEYGVPVFRGPGRDEILARVVADYDRRMSTRWGRFLLWLLRKTT